MTWGPAGSGRNSLPHEEQVLQSLRLPCGWDVWVQDRNQATNVVVLFMLLLPTQCLLGNTLIFFLRPWRREMNLYVRFEASMCVRMYLSNFYQAFHGFTNHTLDESYIRWINKPFPKMMNLSSMHPWQEVETQKFACWPHNLLHDCGVLDLGGWAQRGDWLSFPMFRGLRGRWGWARCDGLWGRAGRWTFEPHFVL